MTTDIEPPKQQVRRSPKQILIDDISKKVYELKNKLAKFDDLRKELSSYEEALKALTGFKEPQKDIVDLYKNDVDLTACSAEGIKIGMELPIDFTPYDLQSKLENNKQKSYIWIAEWKRKGWIGTLSRGVSRKVKN